MIEEHTAHFDFGPVKFQPKPRQPMIPIEVGGTTPAALRRAGRLGDGWIETGSETLEEAREKLDVVLAARVDAGRAECPFEVSLSGRLGYDVDSAINWMRSNGYPTTAVWYPSVAAIGFPFQYMALIRGEWELVVRVGA